MCRLAPFDYCGCDVRSQESKLQDASHVALVTVLAISDLFDRASFAAAKLLPPCMRPDQGRDESEIGRAFAASLAPNHESQLTAAPPELTRGSQHNCLVDLFGARPYGVALKKLFEEFRPAELNHDSICVHHSPLDEMQHKLALGAVRS